MLKGVSKSNIYEFLTLKKKIYLPPEKDVTFKFLKVFKLSSLIISRKL